MHAVHGTATYYPPFARDQLLASLYLLMNELYSGVVDTHISTARLHRLSGFIDPALAEVDGAE